MKVAVPPALGSRMNTRRWSLVATLTGLAILSVPTGCSRAESGPTRFSLKVAVQSSGKPPSSYCSQLGSSTGGASGDDFTADRRFQTALHTTTADGTWYEVDITGLDGNAHSWRYDEAQARAGVTLDARYHDVGGPVDVRISGAFARIDPCLP